MTKELPIGAQFQKAVPCNSLALTIVSVDEVKDQVHVEFKDHGGATCKETFIKSGLLALFERGEYKWILDEFTKGFFQGILFGENDNSDPETGGSPLDRNYDVGNFTQDSYRQALIECLDFQRAQEELLVQFYERYEPKDGYTVQACAGHDFYFTRQGHGVGYWDRGLGELGDKLSEACEPYGSVNVNVIDKVTLELY